MTPKHDLIFPPGDPRNDMSLEEIQRVAQQEEITINRHLSIMAKNVQPPCPVQEEEDDEDTEDFEIDLNKGVVTQNLSTGVFIKDKGTIISGDFDGEGIIVPHPITMVEPLKPILVEDEYSDIIKQSLVHFALNVMRDDVTAAIGKLEEMQADTLRLPTSLSTTLEKEAENLWEQRRELSSAIPFGKGELKYDKIPEWAKPQVKRLMHGAIDQLLSLVDKDKL
jgi:hypothetical protein